MTSLQEGLAVRSNVKLVLCAVKAAVLVVSAISPARAALITANWLAAADGDWDDATQWDSVNFPNNNADTYQAVVAATGSSYTLTLDTTITVDQLTLNSADAAIASSVPGAGIGVVIRRYRVSTC